MLAVWSLVYSLKPSHRYFTVQLQPSRGLKPRKHTRSRRISLRSGVKHERTREYLKLRCAISGKLQTYTSEAQVRKIVTIKKIILHVCSFTFTSLNILSFSVVHKISTYQFRKFVKKAVEWCIVLTALQQTAEPSQFVPFCNSSSYMSWGERAVSGDVWIEMTVCGREAENYLIDFNLFFLFKGLPLLEFWRKAAKRDGKWLLGKSR